LRLHFKDVDFRFPNKSNYLLRQKKNEDKVSEGWVLKNLNFEVIEGDRFGIIGSNGAGKTTLLRLAAGIFKPDAGCIGLVSPTTSLISTSFGIDVELSGIENIFKKARYMGISRQQLILKLDEIIDYSGLGMSINKSVRTYSDGMRIRLASSIALKLASGCIIVDEGIASADLEFSNQVENTMREFYNQVPMALIASHSFQFLQSACSRVGYLKNGKFDFIGTPSEAWDLYVKDVYNL